jgi:transposase
MYAGIGCPSIPAEWLWKTSLLISTNLVRSEQAFCEQLDYNLLSRWFLAMTAVEPSSDPSTLTKSRQALLRHDVAGNSSLGCCAVADARRL